MNENVFPAFVGFFVAAVMTYAMLWLLEPMARRFGLLDHPQGRKDHWAPTPFTGGMAMMLGIVLTSAMFNQWTPQFTYFMAAAALLVLIGVLDDLYDIRWWIRIIAQSAAVMLMVYGGGLRVEHIGQIIGIKSTGLGDWSLPITMIATIGVINAVNMIDGVDGLAGGITLATLSMLEAAALRSGNAVLTERLLIFSGAVVGFLLMNMRLPWQSRARVFMGNAGSALLGFIIAWASFSLTQVRGHPVTPVLAPWLIATPLIDCVTLIMRRLLRGQSPFRADREHMHHLMLDAGFTPAQLTTTLMVTNLSLGLLAAIALIAKVPQAILVLAFVGLCLGYFWLTLRRERGVAAFALLNRCLTRMHLIPGTAMVPPTPCEED